MGANIKHNSFPPQGSYLGKRVDVVFHYDTARVIQGVCVRDDAGEPGRTIFRLDDGRYVLATECQYSLSAEQGSECEQAWFLAQTSDGMTPVLVDGPHSQRKDAEKALTMFKVMGLADGREFLIANAHFYKPNGQHQQVSDEFKAAFSAQERGDQS